MTTKLTSETLQLKFLAFVMFLTNATAVFDEFFWVDDRKTDVELLLLVTIIEVTIVEYFCERFVLSGFTSWLIIIDSLDQNFV